MDTSLSPPQGTVTFLFTDIEGSTRLLQALDDRYPEVLAQHQRLLRAAFQEWRGHEVDTQGDSFFVAFSRAADAVAAAVAAQRALDEYPWPEGAPVRVRMGMHTGEPTSTGTGYVGLDVHRAARLAAAGHGGQVLLSLTTRALVEQDLPEGVSLRDLGSHRLKDLHQPEPIVQLVIPGLPADFPPLTSLDTYRHNLPVQPTRLLGRERELAATQALLRREDVRLLTLTGPGGTGKTRLGLQLAADLLDDFPDGVFSVALAAVSDPGLVPTIIAQKLELRESGSRLPLESLKEFLQKKQLLLLLDNLEQVLAAAPVVAELLTACPRLKVLATSRTSLHLRGEKEYQVPPLALPHRNRLPSLESLSQYASVALFVQRAQDVKHDFALTNENAQAVAEICCRLDGLPLALELAAARIRLLTPQAMLTRLTSRLKLLTGGAQDLPDRHKTLRGTVAWSYDLLDDAERTLFRRLAVFVGGCTLEAAEAVCSGAPGAHEVGGYPRSGWCVGPDSGRAAGPGDLEVDLLDGLESLVGNSLLRQEEGPGGEPRFRMLETIREYAWECLEGGADREGAPQAAWSGPSPHAPGGSRRCGSPEEAAAIQQRHAQFFLALAEAAEPRLTGPERGEWLARLETEHDNLRAVLEWSRQGGDVAIGLRLVGALCDFWQVRGYWADGQERLAGLLALPGAEARTVARGRVVYTAARLAYVRGDLETAQSRYEESLAIGRELGDKRFIASSLGGLGDVARLQGDLETARSLYEEAVALYRELGDRWHITFSLSGLGNVARDQGDLETARAHYEESLRIGRELGDRRGVTAVSLNGLGHVARLQGDLETARSRYEESLAINRELGDKRGITFSLNGLGYVELLQRDFEAARARYEESLATNRELGDKRGTAASLSGLGQVARLQGDLETARALLEESLRLQREMGDQRSIVHSLHALGQVVREQGDDAAARSLLDESRAIRREGQQQTGDNGRPQSSTAIVAQHQS